MVGVLSSWETWKGRHVRNRKINSDDSLTFFCSNMHVLRGLDVVYPVHNLKCPYAVMPFTGLIPTPSSSSANGRLPHGRLTSRSVEKNLKSASWEQRNLGSLIYSLQILFLSLPPICFVKGTEITASLKSQIDIVLPKSSRSYAGPLHTQTAVWNLRAAANYSPRS